MGNGWAGVYRGGGIGDNLIAASVLPALAKRYKVEVLAARERGVVFENNPHIAKLSYVPDDGLPMAGALEWQQWFARRGAEYDCFVNLSHSCEVLAVLMPGQTHFYWPAEWRRRHCDVSYLEVVNEICGVVFEPSRLFFPTEEEQAKATETKGKLGGRVVGWCLAGSRLDKVYPHSAIAIARLIRELNVSVVMFGAPGREFEMAKSIMEHVVRQNDSHDGLHLALSPDPGKPSWPIRRILAQALTCDLVIGPDTGPMWAVAFEAMPKIVLLSHASQKNITHHWFNTTALHADPARVPCWPCHQLHDTIATCSANAEKTGAACISDIGVETILRAAADLLKPS